MLYRLGCERTGTFYYLSSDKWLQLPLLRPATRSLRLARSLLTGLARGGGLVAQCPFVTLIGLNIGPLRSVSSWENLPVSTSPGYFICHSATVPLCGLQIWGVLFNLCAHKFLSQQGIPMWIHLVATTLPLTTSSISIAMVILYWWAHGKSCSTSSSSSRVGGLSVWSRY